jgi:hypothetical protein
LKTSFLAILAGCLLALTICTCWLLLTVRETVARVPSEIAAFAEGLSAQVVELRTDAFAEIDLQALNLETDATTQLSGIRREALGEFADVRKTADRQLTGLRTDLVASVKTAVLPIEGIRTDLQPVLANAASLTESSTHLVDTYAVLPAQLATEFRPSWLALQPEITCRQLDGSGYGGCWHSRITGLMGEAVKVGGVFTQHFPSMVSSVDGIGVDVHTATHKFVAPTSTKAKIWEGFRSMALIASHF